MASRLERKRRREDAADRERQNVDEISGILRVLAKLDENLEPSRDHFTPSQRLSHIKEGNLWSLDDLEQALRKIYANVLNGHPKGSPQHEKGKKILDAGISLITSYRMGKAAGEGDSGPASPVQERDSSDKDAIPLPKSQYLFLINSDGTIQYTGTARKPLAPADVQHLPPHVKVGTSFPMASGLVKTSDPTGVPRFGTDMDKFELPPPPYKPRDIKGATFLEYGDFSSFAPAVESDADPLAREAVIAARAKRRADIKAAKAQAQAHGKMDSDVNHARSVSEDNESDPAALLEANAVLIKKLQSLQEERLAKGPNVAPGKEEVDIAKLIEKNLATLTARTEPSALVSSKTIETATLVIPKYASKDPVFQGTIR